MASARIARAGPLSGDGLHDTSALLCCVADSGGGCRVRALVMNSRAIVASQEPTRAADVSGSDRCVRTVELCSGGVADARACPRGVAFGRWWVTFAARDTGVQTPAGAAPA